jgi:hypothetical protein
MQLPVVAVRTLELMSINNNILNEYALYFMTLQGFFNSLVYGKFSHFEQL